MEHFVESLLTALKTPCSYSKCFFFNKLWHVHANFTNMHTEACEKTLSSPSECNCLVFVTVAVSHNTEDQSAACPSFCSLACQSGLHVATASVAWHPPLACT